VTQWWACVQNLSVNNDNKVKIIEEGGIRALISLLSVQDLALQEHGVGGTQFTCFTSTKVNTNTDAEGAAH